MTDFFKELKTIRTEKGIDLEKIHKRTKISLSALHAIEKGMFDQMPYTYVRLFLRAYALEIGVDPEKTLDELEIYLGNKTSRSKKEVEKVKTEKKDLKIPSNENIKKKPVSKRPSLSIRSDIIKSVFIISTLLFALYIILSINEETEASNPKPFLSEYEEEGPISDQMLQENYIKISETKQALKATYPFSITLTTDQRLWYEIKSDDLMASEQVLPIGDNHFHRFDEKIEIKFNQTLGLNLYLNQNILNIIKSDIYPTKLLISIAEKTITLQQFSPKK